MDNKQIEESKIKSIIHLGPFIIDEKWAYNSYLLPVNDVFVLFDITPLSKYDIFKLAIEKYTSIKNIKWLILQHIHLSTLNVLIELVDDGFKGTIVTNQSFSDQIKQSHLNVQIVEIESINYRLNLGKNDYLQFHVMSFLPFAHMFMTYIHSTQSFMTSTLLSSYYIKPLCDTNELSKQTFQFHFENMPNSTYIKPMLDVIKQTKHQGIFPLFGHVLTYDQKDVVIEYLYKNEFYNSNLYSSRYKSLDDIHINELIDHSINHLNKYFPKIEILDIFLGSPFHLQHDPFKLKKSTLEGYKLYHGFFEHVYAKKGLLWLSILEPIIIRYTETYKLEKPSIYQSLIMQINQEKESIEQKKKELESGYQQLQTQFELVKENALRCPFTQLYYQNVLSEMIKDTINSEEKKSYGVLLITLDQLIDLNKRYGKEIGNESIRNMAYTILELLNPHQQLFKQYGPGIYLFDQQTSLDELKKLSQKIKNAISDSNIFIEKVSVSITTVHSSDIDQQLTDLLQINQIYDTLEKKLILLKDKKTSEIKEEILNKSLLSEGKILLVDEDEMNKNMLFRIFKRLHYEVILASSVEQALELINIYPIELIISEINLSKIDGFQLKQMLNEDDRFKDIPFFMVSHNKTLENIKRGNALDVDLIIQKPIIAEELVGHIKRYNERWYKR